LANVQRIKTTAGRFFKVQNYRKASKIYQRINGWYNFGDAANNYAKEDADSAEFIKDHTELMGLKPVCFANLVVCKFKMMEFASVIAITDQLLEMEPKHVKGLYFRGLSQIKEQDFDGGVKTLSFLANEVDPSNNDFKVEL
jgi:hypothetical protein